MARPLRIQYPGAYYHVTCRGNEQKEIFLDAEDQKIFLEKLSLSLDIYNVSLLAYVCMPNHFHLLVTTPEGNLSEFMHHFNISYTSAFNRRHRRVGHLYQGRYKAFLIDADNYLLEVSRYIHLNPIRIKAFLKKPVKEKWDTLLKYKASSSLGYFSVRERRDFVNYATVLDYMGGDNRKGRQDYQEFVKRGIEQEIENPLELGKGNGIVGEADFIQRIKEKFLNNDASKREQPALRELRKEFKPEELIDHFTHLIRKDKEDICRRGKKSIERAMLMELLYRFCRITQPEIGRLVGGIDYSAVSQARKRLQIRLERELELKKRFNKLSSQLLQLSRGKI
ncbi:transposase [Thermodesulfovibrionales bacterium]|nr:transposase [Thermodesulfovibrionales bacterium]